MRNILKISVAFFVVLIMATGCSLFTTMTDTMNSTDDTMIKGDVMEKDDAMMEDGDVMEKDDDAMMGDDDVMEDDDDAMMEGDGAMEKDDDKMMKNESATGSYEVYSADKLVKANSGKVVLFFHASWCPTCRTLESDINSNLSSIPSDVTILKVNYDTATELKKKYNVTYQHTLVQVDANGELITKWSGGNDLNSVTTKLQ